MSPPASQGSNPAAEPKASVWRTFKSVAWGFLGVRAQRGFQEDSAKLNPFYLIGAGLAATFALVGLLMWLANSVVKT
ncbi:MAG: DUF2970 domain-containing protein [Burkholderiaceae bacterium]